MDEVASPDAFARRLEAIFEKVIATDRVAAKAFSEAQFRKRLDAVTARLADMK